MCDGLKDILEKPAAQDSRNLRDLFNKVGFQYGEDQANYNVKNPGHAISTAGEYALGGYLSSLLAPAQAAEAGTAAAEAAPTAAEAAGQAGSNSLLLAEQQAAEQAAQQAAMQAASSGAQTAAEQAPQGLGNTLDATLQDSGYTPSNLLNAFKNASGSNPLSQNLMNYGKQTLADVMSNPSGAAKGLLDNATSQKGQAAMKLSQGLLSPQGQRPPPPQARPPSGGGQPAPLVQPYQQPGYNSLGSNQSIDVSTLTEDQKQKLRSMGIKI